eukprot:GHVS01063714.1.p1 GENE.GHVS01063714.1~~GHVS01063714.1.p1  ORF type:complete len:897 (+),score=55.20 GHVS01063714.1:115-2805(+)
MNICRASQENSASNDGRTEKSCFGRWKNRSKGNALRVSQYTVGSGVVLCICFILALKIKMLLAAAIFNVSTEPVGDSKFLHIDASDWMSHCEHFALSDLSLPTTLYSTNFSTKREQDSTFCFQTRNIAQQLQDGIRAFNIHAWRRKVDDGMSNIGDENWFSCVPLDLNSGLFNMDGMACSQENLTDSLFKPVKYFLSYHPSEIIIVRFVSLRLEPGGAGSAGGVSGDTVEESKPEKLRLEVLNMARTYWGDFLPSVIKSQSLLQLKPSFSVQNDSGRRFRDIQHYLFKVLIHSPIRVLLGKHDNQIFSQEIEEKDPEERKEEVRLNASQPVQALIMVDGKATALKWMQTTSYAVLEASTVIKEVYYKSDTGGRCLSHGICFMGDDFDQTNVDDILGCQTACQNSRRCRFVSFTPHDGICYMKTGQGNIMESSTCISGPRECSGRSRPAALNPVTMRSDLQRQLCKNLFDCELEIQPGTPTTDGPLVAVDFSVAPPTHARRLHGTSEQASQGLDEFLKWYNQEQVSHRMLFSELKQISFLGVLFYESVAGGETYFELIMRSLNSHASRGQRPYSSFVLIIISVIGLVGVIVLLKISVDIYKKVLRRTPDRPESILSCSPPDPLSESHAASLIASPLSADSPSELLAPHRSRWDAVKLLASEAVAHVRGLAKRRRAGTETGVTEPPKSGSVSEGNQAGYSEMNGDEEEPVVSCASGDVCESPVVGRVPSGSEAPTLMGRPTVEGLEEVMNSIGGEAFERPFLSSRQLSDERSRRGSRDRAYDEAVEMSTFKRFMVVDGESFLDSHANRQLLRSRSEDASSPLRIPLPPLITKEIGDGWAVERYNIRSASTLTGGESGSSRGSTGSTTRHYQKYSSKVYGHNSCARGCYEAIDAYGEGR